MAAIEELRTELEAKFDIDSVVKDITNIRDLDMKSMLRLGGFSENNTFSGGFDLTYQFMAKLRLINTQRSTFNPGSYSYTPKARDLYAKLKKEKYYEAKTE